MQRGVQVCFESRVWRRLPGAQLGTDVERCRHEVRDQHAYGLQRHVLGIRRHQLEAVPTDGRAVGELELTVDRAECRQTDVLALLHRVAGREIGRASCRDRVCPYVWISGVAGSLQKKKTTKTH